MRKLKINFIVDEQATRELECEVNDYLDIAHVKGICLNIKKFEFNSADKLTHSDKGITYSVKAQRKGEYDESINVFFENGELVRINFHTWYYDPENIMVTFSGGKMAFETGREMSVTEEGVKAYMYKMSCVEEI